MTDLGTDLSCFPDLDPAGNTVSGQTALAQAIARRLSTPRGGLFYDPAYGTDLRAFLNEGFTAQRAYGIQSAIETECAKDERVRSASAAVAFNVATQTLAVSVALTTADGPFKLILAVSQLSVAILTIG